MLQFAVVCFGLSYLHPVSKIAANPWGQIWVTGFGAGQGAFVGHGGSQDYVTNVMQQPLPEQQVESSHLLEFELLTLGFERMATAVYGQDTRL